MSTQYSTSLTENVIIQIPLLLIGALSFVVAFAWNDAIKAIIDHYVPAEYKNSPNHWIKLMYAVALTLLMIILITFKRVLLKYGNDSKCMPLVKKLFRHVEVRDICPISVRFLVPRNDVLIIKNALY